jgi:hypothetical protein
MTTGAPDSHEELFVADFYPELGEYLADRHSTGYDAVTARTHFLLWLAGRVGHADAPSSKNGGGADTSDR